MWRRRDPRFLVDFSYERYLARQAELQSKQENSNRSTESTTPRPFTPTAAVEAGDNRSGIDLEYVLKYVES